MSKKFCRFYFNSFRPITDFERYDIDRARVIYRGFTFFGAVTLGFLSYRFRRMKVSMIEPHEAPRETNFLIHVLNDFMSAALGYTLGNLIACDYIYKRR